MSTGWARLSLVTTGAGLAVVAEQRRHPVAVERGRHDEDAQVGPQVAAGVERQGEAEVGLQAALVELVEDHQPDAVEPGSRCSRRVRMPSVTTSTRVAGPTARSSRVR